MAIQLSICGNHLAVQYQHVSEATIELSITNFTLLKNIILDIYHGKNMKVHLYE
jgi:hypothetical protein